MNYLWIPDSDVTGIRSVGQGRIAEILSQKDEDRRLVFEEAAGISKYRYRKAECERKLNYTNDNLIRTGDIITELEGRVGPLEEQSKKARLYIDLQAELKTLEISLWLYELNRMENDIEKAKNDFDTAGITLEFNRKSADSSDAEIEAMYGEIRLKDIENENLRQEISMTETDISGLREKIALLKNNIENSRFNIERIEKEILAHSEREGDISRTIEENIVKKETV